MKYFLLLLIASFALCWGMNQNEKKIKIKKNLFTQCLSEGNIELCLKYADSNLQGFIADNDQLNLQDLVNLSLHLREGGNHQQEKTVCKEIFKRCTENIKQSKGSLQIRKTPTGALFVEKETVEQAFKAIEALFGNVFDSTARYITDFWKLPQGRYLLECDKKYITQNILLMLFNDCIQLFEKRSHWQTVQALCELISETKNMPQFYAHAVQLQFCLFKTIHAADEKESARLSQEQKNIGEKIKLLGLKPQQVSQNFKWPFYGLFYTYTHIMYSKDWFSNQEAIKNFRIICNQPYCPKIILAARGYLIEAIIRTNPEFIKSKKTLKELKRLIRIPFMKTNCHPEALANINCMDALICTREFQADPSNNSEKKQKALNAIAVINELLPKVSLVFQDELQKRISTYLVGLGHTNQANSNLSSMAEKSGPLLLLQAQSYIKGKKYKKARSAAQQAFEKATDTDTKIKALLSISSTFLSEENYNSALLKAQEAKNILNNSPISDAKKKLFSNWISTHLSYTLLYTDIQQANQQLGEIWPKIQSFESKIDLFAVYVATSCILGDLEQAKKQLESFEKKYLRKKRNHRRKKKKPKKITIPPKFLQTKALVLGLTAKNKTEQRKHLEQVLEYPKGDFTKNLARLDLAFVHIKTEPEKALKLLKETADDSDNYWAQAQASAAYAMLFLHQQGITDITTLANQKIIKESPVLKYLLFADQQPINPMAKAEVQPILCALAETNEDRIKRINWTFNQEFNKPKQLWALDQIGCLFLRDGRADLAKPYFEELATQSFDSEWQTGAKAWLTQFDNLLAYAE